MKNFQAIIFDMNGVIIDDEHLHKQAEILTCEHFGLVVPETEWEKFRGRKSTEIFGQIIKTYGTSNLSVDELVEYKAQQYFAIAQDAELVVGALDFIKWGRDNFKYIALATSGLKIIQEFVFKKFELYQYFDVVITADEVEQGKPHPEIYLQTVNRLGLLAEECLVIEDSDNGIMAGKAAGCFTYGLTTSFPKEVLVRAGANQVFDTFSEMNKFLI